MCQISHGPCIAPRKRKRYNRGVDILRLPEQPEGQMAVSNLLETKYYGDVGFLYPYDVRHDAGDRAFCNPLPDGRVQFRLVTQHGFREATLVYNCLLYTSPSPR